MHHDGFKRFRWWSIGAMSVIALLVAYVLGKRKGEDAGWVKEGK